MQSCVVLPFDAEASLVAADLWASSTRRQRRELGDLLIAAVAISRGLPLVTRNRRDFHDLALAAGRDLRLLDWSRAPSRR